MDSIAIKWWIRFLKSSNAYSLYHHAITNDDAALQRKLLKRFPRLHDLHQDFGDIFPLKLLTDTKAFNAWIEPRRHFFTPCNVIRFVDDPATYVKADGKLLLEIEFTDDMGKVQNEMRQVILGYYYTKVHALLHGVNALPPHPTPKYRLHTDSDKLNTATLGAVRKAYYVANLQRKLQAETGKKITQSELVLAIKREVKNPLKFKLGATEENEVKKDGCSQRYLDTPELSLVKRHLKAYKAYTRNVLQGRFPDHT
jgi:hypothetical protein